jgi:hypothetical protein
VRHIKQTLGSLAAGALATVAAGAVVTSFAEAAHAATTPPWENPSNTTLFDSNDVGQLKFYNAAGQQITGGPVTNAPIAAYVQGTTILDPADTKATLLARTPVSGENAGLFTGEGLSLSTTYPVSTPANLASSNLPVVTGHATDEDLSTFEQDFPNTDNSTTDGYGHVFQLRLISSNPNTTTTYDAADIQVTDYTNAATWSVLYPAPAAVGTSVSVSTNASSLVGSPTGDGTHVYSSTPVTLTATLTATDGTTPQGTVQFENGSAPIGGPVSVQANGTASLQHALPAGSDTINAAFTPATPGTDSAGDTLVGYGASDTSTSGSAPVTVASAPAAATTTALVVNPTHGPAETTAVSLTGTVASGGNALTSSDGQVQFYDNGSDTSGNVTSSSVSLGSAPLSSTGVASLQYSSFAEGDHNIVAKFNPADPSAFAASTSASILYTADAPTWTPHQQTTQVEIPAGNLTITTPYTPTSPFDLGTATLSGDGTYFWASNQFGNSASPQNGVTITDTRAGDQDWTASVETTNFSGGANVINGQNLEFTQVAPSYITGNALQSGDVIANDVPSGAITTTGTGTGTSVTAATPFGATATGNAGLAGSPHQFASAAAGDGSVYVDGQLTLVAPSSTPPGAYTATVTFTIA